VNRFVVTHAPAIHYNPKPRKKSVIERSRNEPITLVFPLLSGLSYTDTTSYSNPNSVQEFSLRKEV